MLLSLEDEVDANHLVLERVDATLGALPSCTGANLDGTVARDATDHVVPVYTCVHASCDILIRHTDTIPAPRCVDAHAVDGLSVATDHSTDDDPGARKVRLRCANRSEHLAMRAQRQPGLEGA